MPWKIINEANGCSGFAVVKEDTGKVIGCHPTKEEAEAHLSALYANEPAAAVKALSDESLIAAHQGLHNSSDLLKSADVAAHHYLAEELRKRGLGHPDSDSELHKAVIEMSVVRIPVASLSKRLSAKEIETVVDMAVKNGTAYANVHEMLTSNGWVLSASPATPEEDDESDDMEEYGWDLTELQIATMEGIEEVIEKFGKYRPSGYADSAHYMGASENPFRSKGMKCVNCVAFHGARACEWVEGDIDPEALCKLWVIPQSMLATPTSTKAVSLSLRSNQQPVMESTEKDATMSDVHSDTADWQTPKKKKPKELLAIFKEEDEEDNQVGKASNAKVGDFVSWDNAGGVARGKITQILREGTLQVPDTSFKIKAENDDPAVMIRLYRPDETNGGYKAEDVLVGHKMSELRSIQSLEKAESMSPPQGVRDAAQRAVEWIKEGKNGDGFTAVGRARASQLAGGSPVSMDTIRRMQNYFTRHEKDKEADGFFTGSDKYPSPGRVAWDAWGGDAGKSWANKVVGSETAQKSLVYKANDEMRFTLGPWYVPNMADAHDEWTDQLELQKSLWEYVRKGDRSIRLQHTPDTKAGEWVEAMTMPFDMEVPMTEPDTNVVSKKVFPEGTVFLGVVWEPWAWEMVKKGEIRGYSIGGSAERHEMDIPSIVVDVA